mgnify:CR=1 FL=1
MFDNVYWHHTNRACMVMLLRATQDALIASALRPEELIDHDDDSLLARLASAQAAQRHARRLRDDHRLHQLFRRCGPDRMDHRRDSLRCG